jgi:general secretion pathway protein A
MNYLQFFNLKEDPFKITPDHTYFFESLTHRSAKNLLKYVVESGEGFGVIIGEPGTGKTTILRKFLSDLPKNYIAAFILNPMLSPDEFLKILLDEFSIKYDKDISKNEILKEIKKFLEKNVAEGKKVLIVIDEAQLMPFETLEELRLLSNLETEKEKLVQIILVGQPELEEKLQDPKLRQLNDRITNKVFLERLSKDEVSKYINHRLKLANADKKIIFTESAVEEIYKHSKGVPRLINLLASRGLMAAFVENSYIVNQKHILSALHALNRENNPDEKKSHFFIKIILILEFIGVVVLLIYIYLNLSH